MVGSLAALSSPLCSSKSKAWTGLRKSAVVVRGTGVSIFGLTDVTLGVLVVSVGLVVLVALMDLVLVALVVLVVLTEDF